jgi:hypothetical protein
METVTRLTLKLEEKYKDNTAVQKFIGTKENNPDLRQYQSWYDTDVLQYLTHTLPENHDVFRYVFTLDNNEIQSYYKQFITLCHLSRELKKCIYFIGIEFPISQNHFIFGVILNEELLIINPIGITSHKDFPTLLQNIKGYGKIKRIYQSNMVLQTEKDNEGLFSCGPICVELMRHISELPLEIIIKSFITWQNTGAEQVDLTSLLPLSLQKLPQLTIEAYHKAILEIRANHLELLQHFEDKLSIEEQNIKLDNCLICKEQNIVFEIKIPTITSTLPDKFIFSISEELQKKYQTLWCKKSFMQAIRTGNIADLQQLLQINPELLNSLTLQGDTALIIALQKRKQDVIEFLLSKGARMDGGGTPYNNVKHFAEVNTREFVSLIDMVLTKQTLLFKDKQTSYQGIASTVKTVTLSAHTELTDSKYTTIPTAPGGDCAFHAALGAWNDNDKKVTYQEVGAKRQAVAAIVKEAKPGTPLYKCIREAIQAILMSNEKGGPEIERLRNNYNQHNYYDAWQIFEQELKLHQVVIEYINKCMENVAPNKMARLDTLQRKFQQCLDMHNGELYGIILSIEHLDKAFKQYNDTTSSIFDLDRYLISNPQVIKRAEHKS